MQQEPDPFPHPPPAQFLLTATRSWQNQLIYQKVLASVRIPSFCSYAVKGPLAVDSKRTETLTSSWARWKDWYT